MAPIDIPWTEDAIVRLRELWDEGHSTAEIGRRLGRTKNAVVGKAHRLRLPPRPSPIQWGERTGEPSTPTPDPAPAMPHAAHSSGTAPARPAAARAAPAASVPGPPLARRQVFPRRCCWPLGEPGRTGFRFCDAVADAGKPYCPEHRVLAYAKPTRPQGDRRAP